MKKILILLWVFLLPMLGLIYAQTPAQKQQVISHQNHEKQQRQSPRHSIDPMMMKMKKTFIQENLIIDSNRQAAFWNAYNQYERRVLAIHKEQRDFRKQHKIPHKLSSDSLDSLSNETIINYYDSKFSSKKQFFQAEETFYQDLKNCLTAKQIAQYYLLEKSFRKSAVKARQDTAAKTTIPAKSPVKILQAAPLKK